MSRYDWPTTPPGEGGGDDPAGRGRFNARRRTEFDAEEARIAAITPQTKSQHPGRRAPPSGRQRLWQPLGPQTIIDGQANGGPRISGRMNALAVHPDGERIYAASANGGVWYSADGGENWESLGGLASTDTEGIERPAHRNACGALAVAFGETNIADVVYVGTGEVTHPYGVTAEAWMSGQPGHPFGGVGILRSEHTSAAHSSVTWVREANNLIGNGVYRIVMEPGGNTVIAATLTGLYQRSDTPGPDVDWVRPSGAPFDTLNVECTDLLWTDADGTRPARLWVWVQRGPDGGLWVRDNGQTDFTKIETPGSTGRRAVLAASTPPDQVWVFTDHPDVTTANPSAPATARNKDSTAPLGEDRIDCWFRSSEDVRHGFIRLSGTPKPVPVTYSVINGRAILEGDIDLGTAEEVEAFSETVRALQPEVNSSTTLHTGADSALRGVAITGQHFRWPGGIVPWVAQPGLRSLAQRAVAHWESRTRIRFVERVPANQTFYPNWVSFEAVDGCKSPIGMRGGKQVISLGDGCGFGPAVHEIGHSLGLWHEQSREDRDTHVRIVAANIKPGKEHNFDQHITDGDDIGSYDFASIMHYPRTAFSRNGEDTIVVLGGQKIGQREALSGGDVAAIRTLYPDLERPLLFRVTATGSATPVAAPVIGLPDVLKKQGFDAIAIAVHPTTPNRIVLGGSQMQTTTTEGVVIDGNGAIIVADVTAVGGYLHYGVAGSPFAMISGGVPPDIHDLKYSNAGTRLWTACNGGVFRSDRPESPVGFRGCNNGIDVAETRHLGNHPFCDGRIVACLMDAAVGERMSNGVWKLTGLRGGGGIAFDPLRPDRFITQYSKGEWSTSDGTLTGGELLTRAGTFALGEDSASAVFSMPAAIGNRRGIPPPVVANIGQLVIGTNRLWYSEDFGVSWVTLPSGTDPLPSNLSQDSFDESITVCRWQSPDVGWALGEGKLMRYVRTPGSDNGGVPGAWSRETIITKRLKNKKDATSAEGPIRDSAVWTDIAVNLDPPPGPGQPPVVHGTKGALYMGTVGKPGDSNVDTLWWFDGTSKWFKTGLRTDTTGVSAPVISIVCDPAFHEEVYVGTTVGVWKGVRTQVGNAVPAWTWHKRLNGLPEAAVEDLAIFSDGGLRLLRAAIASRGVWELRLDVTDVQDLTYVRAHDDDLRYRPPVSTQRNGSTPRSWHGSPDVRPRTAPSTLTVPTSLPWTRGFFDLDNNRLRRFQAALRSRTADARVRPTGEWDLHFNEVLRDLGAPPLPSPPAAANVVSIDAAFWSLSMVPPHATMEPWGSGTPTEADLLEFTPALNEGDSTRTSCTLPARACKIDIVVHHRGLDPIDGANVRVTLLKWIDPKTKNRAKWNDHTTWFTGDVPWTGAVNDVLNSDAGTTTKTFAAGWSFVGTTNATRRRTLNGQTLDPLRSGIATFDLTGLKKNTVMLLVAVIRSGTDSITLTTKKLEELAMNNPNVAVRSIRIT